MVGPSRARRHLYLVHEVAPEPGTTAGPPSNTTTPASQLRRPAGSSAQRYLGELDRREAVPAMDPVDRLVARVDRGLHADHALAGPVAGEHHIGGDQALRRR